MPLRGYHRRVVVEHPSASQGRGYSKAPGPKDARLSNLDSSFDHVCYGDTTSKSNKQSGTIGETGHDTRCKSRSQTQTPQGRRSVMDATL